MANKNQRRVRKAHKRQQKIDNGAVFPKYKYVKK